MGKFLFIGVIMLLVAGIANVFIQCSALMITLSVLAIGIFSAFILYDLKRVQDGEETNYITATLGVYLSLYNVFQSLLALLGIFGGEQRLITALRRHQERGPAGPFSYVRQREVEHRHALDVRGVREHVHHARRRAAVAGLVHQQPGIARQRGRVAADVDDAPRRRPAGRGAVQFGQRLGQREGALARRVDQPACRPAQRHAGRRRRSRTGCAPRSASCAARPLSARVVARALHQRLAALDAQHLRAPAWPAAA